MTVATVPAEPLGFPIAASAASASTHAHAVKTEGFARRTASLIGDGLLVLLLPYGIALAIVAVCLPVALLFAVLRWLGLGS